MATSTILQTLNPAADGGLASASNRRQVETFLASGTIRPGDWVIFDTTKTGADRVLYVAEASVVATHGNGACVGVSLDDVVAGESVKVVVAGYAGAANVGAGTAANDLLVGPIGTAGQAEPFNPGTTESPPVGFALGPHAAGQAPVWVFKRF